MDASRVASPSLPVKVVIDIGDACSVFVKVARLDAVGFDKFLRVWNIIWYTQADVRDFTHKRLKLAIVLSISRRGVALCVRRAKVLDRTQIDCNFR